MILCLSRDPCKRPIKIDLRQRRYDRPVGKIEMEIGDPTDWPTYSQWPNQNFHMNLRIMNEIQQARAQLALQIWNHHRCQNSQFDSLRFICLPATVRGEIFHIGNRGNWARRCLQTTICLPSSQHIPTKFVLNWRYWEQHSILRSVRNARKIIEAVMVDESKIRAMPLLLCLHSDLQWQRLWSNSNWIASCEFPERIAEI
jgi:hypothetical protein